MSVPIVSPKLAPTPLHEVDASHSTPSSPRMAAVDDLYSNPATSSTRHRASFQGDRLGARRLQSTSKQSGHRQLGVTIEDDEEPYSGGMSAQHRLSPAHELREPPTHFSLNDVDVHEEDDGVSRAQGTGLPEQRRYQGMGADERRRAGILGNYPSPLLSPPLAPTMQSTAYNAQVAQLERLRSRLPSVEDMEQEKQSIQTRLRGLPPDGEEAGHLRGALAKIEQNLTLAHTPIRGLMDRRQELRDELDTLPEHSVTARRQANAEIEEIDGLLASLHDQPAPGGGNGLEDLLKGMMPGHEQPPGLGKNFDINSEMPTYEEMVKMSMPEQMAIQQQMQLQMMVFNLMVTNTQQKGDLMKKAEDAATSAIGS